MVYSLTRLIAGSLATPDPCDSGCSGIPWVTAEDVSLRHSPTHIAGPARSLPAVSPLLVGMAVGREFLWEQCEREEKCAKGCRVVHCGSPQFNSAYRSRGADRETRKHF